MFVGVCNKTNHALKNKRAANDEILLLCAACFPAMNMRLAIKNNTLASKSVICGHHVYGCFPSLHLGEKLGLLANARNVHNLYTASAMKSGIVVGNVLP